MEFVSWDDEIPIYGKKMFQITNQYSSIRVPNFDSYPYVAFYSRVNAYKMLLLLFLSTLKNGTKCQILMIKIMVVQDILPLD